MSSTKIIIMHSIRMRNLRKVEYEFLVKNYHNVSYNNTLSDDRGTEGIISQFLLQLRHLFIQGQHAMISLVKYRNQLLIVFPVLFHRLDGFFEL